MKKSLLLILCIGVLLSSLQISYADYIVGGEKFSLNTCTGKPNYVNSTVGLYAYDSDGCIYPFPFTHSEECTERGKAIQGKITAKADVKCMSGPLFSSAGGERITSDGQVAIIKYPSLGCMKDLDVFDPECTNDGSIHTVKYYLNGEEFAEYTGALGLGDFEYYLSGEHRSLPDLPAKAYRGQFKFSSGEVWGYVDQALPTLVQPSKEGLRIKAANKLNDAKLNAKNQAEFKKKLSAYRKSVKRGMFVKVVEGSNKAIRGPVLERKGNMIKVEAQCNYYFGECRSIQAQIRHYNVNQVIFDNMNF